MVPALHACVMILATSHAPALSGLAARRDARRDEVGERKTSDAAMSTALRVRGGDFGITYVPDAFELTVAGVLLGAATAWASVHVVSQNDELIVERLGKFHAKLGAGLHVLLPLADKVVFKTTLREQVLDVPPQQCLTRDNIPVTADAVVFFRVTEPCATRYAVADHRQALTNLAHVQLREGVSQLLLDDVVQARHNLAQILHQGLNPAVQSWGLEVTRVEVKDVNPSAQLLSTIEMQAAAERMRKAVGQEEQGRDAVSLRGGLSLSQAVRATPEAAPTMDDVIASINQRNDNVKSLTPQDVLTDLRAGNARFWTGKAARPDLTPMQRRALALGQAPKVAVLGCADSRVPIEIVFDQGPGDIFTLRVAGNVHGSHVAGSLDYAVHHLNIKLVVVLGHEGCGAVKAAQLAEADIKGEQPYLRDMLLGMKKDLKANSKDLDSIADPRARDREAVIANTRAQVHKILEDKAMRAKVKAGELLVVGGFYEISSGVVDLFEVVNPELLK
mmetsp:Transcript_7410/g.20175  ORF Transcript_7410/g.20175 Transcript_7410/m.20175 type:complete len:504 (-) Transcript_7410:1542-3053(-)